MITFARVASLVLCVAGLVQSVHAQDADYPNKPIRLIVPFPPGGGTDIVARTMARKLSEALKQSVIVDNRAGGGGTIGAEAIVHARPDGYTLIFGAASYATNAALYKLPYDPVNDITPIGLIGETGYVVVMKPELGIKTTADLIAYAKAHPGQLNYGSSGTGGLSHLGSVLFDMMAGTKMTHVPYKGMSPALTDLLGDQIQLMLGSEPTLIPYVKSNRLNGIAVTTAKRSGSMPDVPAIAETLPGYEASLWYALWGPKNLPPSIVARLNKEIGLIVQMADFKALMANEGVDPLGGTPEEMHRVLKADIEKWSKVVAAANVKVTE